MRAKHSLIRLVTVVDTPGDRIRSNNGVTSICTEDASKIWVGRKRIIDAMSSKELADLAPPASLTNRTWLPCASLRSWASPNISCWIKSIKAGTDLSKTGKVNGSTASGGLYTLATSSNIVWIVAFRTWSLYPSFKDVANSLSTSERYIKSISTTIFASEILATSLASDSLFRKPSQTTANNRGNFDWNMSVGSLWTSLCKASSTIGRSMAPFLPVLSFTIICSILGIMRFSNALQMAFVADVDLLLLSPTHLSPASIWKWKPSMIAHINPIKYFSNSGWRSNWVRWFHKRELYLLQDRWREIAPTVAMPSSAKFSSNFVLLSYIGCVAIGKRTFDSDCKLNSNTAASSESTMSILRNLCKARARLCNCTWVMLWKKSKSGSSSRIKQLKSLKSMGDGTFAFRWIISFNSKM